MHIREQCDVAVVGGGTAGAIAAIAAARTGAKTVLVEQYGSLGGLLGSGLNAVGALDCEGYPALGGVGEELFARLREMGAPAEHVVHPVLGSSSTVLDPEMVRLVLMEMYANAGGQLLLHSFLVDALVRPGNPIKLEGVVIANKSGLQALPAKVVVDATGDADVAAWAGASFQKGRESDGRMQPATTIFRVCDVDLDRTFRYIEDKHPDEVFKPAQGVTGSLAAEYSQYLSQHRVVSLPGAWGRQIEEARSKGEWDFPKNYISMNALRDLGEVHINATRVAGVDCSNVDELSRAEQESQRQILVVLRFLRKYVPGFEKCRIMSVGSQLGVRETRRIIGPYVLTATDVLEGREFEDCVARGAHALDIHDVGAGQVMGKQATGTSTTMIRLKRSFAIPYRCLYPVNVDNLLVAGRCISTSHEAAGAARGMPACMAIGHAAGTAAAMSAQSGVVPSALPIVQLQNMLRKQAAVLKRER